MNNINFFLIKIKKNVNKNIIINIIKISLLNFI